MSPNVFLSVAVTTRFLSQLALNLSHFTLFLSQLTLNLSHFTLFLSQLTLNLSQIEAKKSCIIKIKSVT